MAMEAAEIPDTSLRVRTALFVVLAVVQIGVPAAMIFYRELALHRGVPVKFRVRPFDPYDALRGRYVRLVLDRVQVKKEEVSPDLWKRLDHSRRKVQAWAVIDVDQQGFARVRRLSAEHPEKGLYIRAETRRAGSDSAVVSFPFTRFYMDEFKAPRAEKAIRRRRTGQGRPEAYVVVRIYKGTAVIEDLFVDGKPIRSFLKHREKTGGS